MAVLLQEITSPGCKVCEAFEAYWHSVESKYPNVTFQKVDVVTPEGAELVSKHMIMASPGILINGELFSTGGFDTLKIEQKLNELGG